MHFNLNIVNVVLENPWKVLEFHFYIWVRTLNACSSLMFLLYIYRICAHDSDKAAEWLEGSTLLNTEQFT